MKAPVRKKLEKKGWRVGNTQDFLELSPAEMQLVECRIALGRLLRETREGMGYTQKVLASEIGTSQSRVAKMEAGDSSVTIDLLLKSLFHIVPKNDVCSYLMT